MNKLKIVLAAQLLFFLAWGGWLLSSRNSAGPEFYLELRPRDPRDLLSGTFMALNYDISNPGADVCPAVTNPGATDSFYMKLEDRGRKVRTEQGLMPVYEAVNCDKNAGDGPGWVQATLQPGFRGGSSVIYGIERFYLNENDPRKDMSVGDLTAKVKIDGRRKLVLLDLLKKV